MYNTSINILKIYDDNHDDHGYGVCACRARLYVWIGLTNILFIDESMAVHFIFGFIIWNYSCVRYNT